MGRYINAEAIINNLKGILEEYADNGLYPTGFGIEEAIDMIEDMPTADVKEVKHGKWIYIPETAYTVSVFECSACGCYRLERCTKREFLYCPWCGAKMDLEEEEQ